MKTYPIRLSPGQDLKCEIDHIAKSQSWSAGCIISAVGSLTEVAIRYANRDEVEILKGHFEIVSLSGTVASSGSHLHIAISDKNGRTIGGHLKEGSHIYTTAEIVLGVMDDWTFSREQDDNTGYLELKIDPV